MARYPRMFRVRQKFDGPRLIETEGGRADFIESAVERELTRLKLTERIEPGESVAITAGSRGIQHVHRITRAIVQHLLRLGARPFLVPSMGSHGGATAEGQQHVIESYGMTEEYVGCPIRSSMETVIVCQTDEGFPVHFDRHAYEADHVLVCGRIKPHTDFVGEIESGLMKMMLIGLGKHAGANVYHRAIHDYNFGQIVRSVGRRVLRDCRIAAGVAVVENGYDETAQITAVAPEEFEDREKELLVLAKRWLPRLPFREVDLLLIDEIGKNISGSGMDTNVVGRKHNDHKAQPDEWPKVRRIALRSVTAASHGNAIGLGMAEFCKTSLIRAADQRATWINGLTSGHISAAMTPLHYETDREILDAALPTIGLREPGDARVLWIRNTLHLAELECSETFLEEARERSDLTVLSEPRELPLDGEGNLPRFVFEPENAAY